MKPIIGHIFIVKTRGVMEDRSIERMTILLQADSQDEVSSKLRYMVDLSRYVNFRITSVEKIRQKFHILNSRIIPVEVIAEIGLSVESPAGEDKQRTNQTAETSGVRVFSFGAIGKLAADNDAHAMRRVGSWLVRLGKDLEVSNPFFEGGRLVVEEDGPIDSAVTSQSVLNRMDATHFRPQRAISGGAPSLGKR